MGGAVVLSVVLLGLAAGWSAGPGDSGCPSTDPLNYTVTLPYPGDCSRFLMCFHGRAVPMHCPQGTYFNNATHLCDWPARSGCVQPNSTSVCSPADLVPLHPVPGNCSAFFACSGGLPVRMDCPEGLFFNSRTLVCDWPASSGCLQPTQPTKV